MVTMANVQYHGAFANNCQNVYEKQVIFKGFQKPHISRCQNKTLCHDSSILVLPKNNFKVDGSASILGWT